MNQIIPIEIVEQKILMIRGNKVMVDPSERPPAFVRQGFIWAGRDLASLYGVETRVLNQAVRRNIDCFPEDFMFSLTRQ